MDAAIFRSYYDYHFAQNRELWDSYIMVLSQEQFTRPSAYSIGSVRNHIVHLIGVDDVWFSELCNIEPLKPLDSDDRQAIRAHWDAVEGRMRDYLGRLRDDMVSQKPIRLEEDKDLMVWQVLLHVINHGTDHRAQLLRLMNDLGVTTGPQDYIFYAYDHPIA